MINLKTEKECILEIIKENRPIVDLNLNMAKKHIKIKRIKKASKKKVNENLFNFFDAFMEEAYKQLRLDGISLAKEKLELTSEFNIEEESNKNTKIISETTIDCKDNNKIDSTSENKTNLFKKNKFSKPKTLDCPPCTDNSINTELISPFTEVKRKDGSSQLGFSFSITKTPVEKIKKNTPRKRVIRETVCNDSISQLSIFSLI